MGHLEAAAVEHPAKRAVVLDVGVVRTGRPRTSRSPGAGRKGDRLNAQSVFTQGCDAQTTVSPFAWPPQQSMSVNVSALPSNDQRAVIL